MVTLHISEHHCGCLCPRTDCWRGLDSVSCQGTPGLGVAWMVWCGTAHRRLSRQVIRGLLALEEAVGVLNELKGLESC